MGAAAGSYHRHHHYDYNYHTLMRCYSATSAFLREGLIDWSSEKGVMLCLPLIRCGGFGMYVRVLMVYGFVYRLLTL